MKKYAVEPSGNKFVVVMYDESTGEETTVGHDHETKELAEAAANSYRNYWKIGP